MRKKKDKRRQSTQDLLGIKKITDYCISTDAGDLVFYIIKPTNISVLPAGAVSAKIRALQNTLSAQAGVELLAMNSRESFNATCLFYHDRMQEEKNPAIRELLEQDRAFLDEKAGKGDLWKSLPPLFPAAGCLSGAVSFYPAAWRTRPVSLWYSIWSEP